MIEKGLCQCGCGAKTKIVKQNDIKRGRIKGQPFRFICGHNRGNNPLHWKGGQTYCRGYLMKKAIDHPKRRKNGYVYDHILIGEKVLGKSLTSGVVIHHFPSIKNFTNLIICQNKSYHKLLHRRYRAFLVSGNPNFRKCFVCKNYDDPKNLHRNYHKKCWNIYHKEYRENH